MGLRRLSVNYSETTAVSDWVAWISSSPPVIAHVATATMVMTTSVIRTRFTDRDDPFPT